ncbi:MAG: Co2+/Mg2+ efflux protein ApaG [Phycisphaerales bacterium]|nr:Co2+/Mg2+ efflux protein ApaG [Phycisphaerales bacterium]
MEDQSDPTSRKYVFGYRIVITNQSDQAIQVMGRRWLIIDSAGREREVRGEGVVGQQPVLQPGEHFEYSSFCPLPTPWGTMEGSYLIHGESGSFAATIGRFYLVWNQDDQP